MPQQGPPQSIGQLKHVSVTSHVPLPQQAPQSSGQLTQLSFCAALHEPSPHPWHVVPAHVEPHSHPFAAMPSQLT